MKSSDIRKAIVDKKLKQWEVARELHISEYTLIRWLRDEIIEDGRAKDIVRAINELDYARQRK